MTTSLSNDPRPADSDLLIGLNFCSGRLSLAGELDDATAPRLLEAATVLRDLGGSDLVIDLAKLDFVCAAGLNALVRIAAAQQADGYALRLTNLPAGLRRYFTLGRADWLLAD